MEAEEFGNFSDISFDYPVTKYVVQDVVFTLICVIAVIANVLLIYTILKFKRMRTIPNLILANWAIADLTCLVTTPSTYRLLAMIDRISLSSTFMCSLYELGGAAQVTSIIHAILLSIDWYVAAHFENASVKFRKYMKTYIAIIWILNFLVLCVSIVYCFNNYFAHWLQTFIGLFGFIGLFLFVIILQIRRIIRKCRRRQLSYPTVMLNVVTSFVLSWSAGFANIFIMSGFGIFYRSIEFVSSILVYCTSIIIFWIFYRNNLDFQACLSRLFRRDRNNYEEADFNFGGSDKNPIIKNTEQCLYNNKEENVFVC